MERNTRSPFADVRDSHQPVYTTGDPFIDPGQGEQLARRGGRITVREVAWNSDEAVTAAYIDELKKKFKSFPQSRTEVYLPHNLREDLKDALQINDTRVYNFLSPEMTQYLQRDSLEVRGLPALALFGLFPPLRISSLDNWIKETGKQYKSPISRYSKLGSSGLGANDFQSTDIESEFIQLQRGWHEYHIKFVEALNIVDIDRRVAAVEQIGIEVFKQKPVGFITSKTVSELSLQDNPLLWMTYNVFNTIISPDQEISHVARFRALEVLASFNDKYKSDPQNNLEKVYFGLERELSSRRPSYGFKQSFEEKLLRLPRAFWAGANERGQEIHKGWQSNPLIVELLGNQTAERRVIDYGNLFSQLVREYPMEAVQISLLFLNTEVHNRAAFHGLIEMAKLAQIDPIVRAEVFGPYATFLTIHQSPKDQGDLISDALGLVVYGGEDPAKKYEGLPADMLLTVIRRLSNDLDRAMEELIQYRMRDATAYFNSMDARTRAQKDREGILQILGVNPDTARADIEEIAKRSYHVLVKKYHPSGGTEPDPEKIKSITVAYERFEEIMRDEQLRKGYFGW